MRIDRTRSPRRRPFALAVVVSALLLPGAVAASEWPHLRGPALDGSTDVAGVFPEGEFGLASAWRIPVGSGYSGIAVSRGRVVTMFADGESDWVGAFDAASGRPVWKYRLDVMYAGHDGSDDGPLSSPVIADDLVYAVAPRGRLLAVKLGDGKLAWEADLTAFNAAKPLFGFSTTPVVEGDALIVLAGGGEGNSIIAFDRKNGKKLWAHGDDEVQYQSPSVMTLSGRRQVVAVTNGEMHGLDASNGEVLWRHEMEEGFRANAAHPTFIGDDRFLIHSSEGATAFRVSLSGDEFFVVEKAFGTNALGRSYGIPVVHDGHIYGFRGEILTCIDAETGDRVWRSRPPGGAGLILVDGRLVIWGAKGNVVVAEASPEGYNELARATVLDGSSLTWPAFAAGRVFVRNLDEMAAVAIGAPRKPDASKVARAPERGFSTWLARVAAASDADAKVDQFLERTTTFPVVEMPRVHFLYEGRADDVAIAGTMLDDGETRSMERVGDTNLFHASFTIEPGARWEYRFQVDFDEWVTDARNPRTVAALEGEGEMSEFVTREYGLSEATEDPRGDEGGVDELELESESLGATKKITVWTPPGYDDSDARYPLLVVNDGDAWLERAKLTNVLDNVVGNEVAPVVVAFVQPSPRWWLEAGGSSTKEYAHMLATELVPRLAETYRLTTAPGTHALLGNRFYGFASLYTALAYPTTFGGAAAQSYYGGLGHGDELHAMIARGSGVGGRYYVDWNRYEEKNGDRGWDLAADSLAITERLRGAGYEVAGGEMLDSFGWGAWSNRAASVLAELFPAE